MPPRDSVLTSALRALTVAFAVVIGLCLGLFFITVLIGALSGSSPEAKLTTVNTEEILPNAEGVRQVQGGDVPVILQIDIAGVIGLENLDAPSIRQMLVESREGDFKNDRVKGILLHLNTPGGTVTDGDGIYRALLDYKEKYHTPIYAFADGLCASAGYEIALAADKIFATDASLVANVGVLIATPFFNLTKVLNKLEIETLTLSAGKGKDALSPFRPWKSDEDANLRQVTDFYYDAFVNRVVKHRPEITKEKLVDDYGAKIFPAPLAKEYGFIDVSGASMSETLKELLKAANITDENYQVIRLENKSWLKTLFGGEAGALFTGKVQHQLSITPEFDLMMRHQVLYLYAP